MKRYHFFLIAILFFKNILCSSIPLAERRVQTLEKSNKSLSEHIIKNVPELKKLLGKNNNQKDIIILNDIIEIPSKFKFITKDTLFKGPAVTIELVKALYEKQAILCTKSLMINFYFLAHIWKSFLELEPDVLQKHYLFLNDMSLLQIEAIKRIMIEIDNIFIESDESDEIDSKIQAMIDVSYINKKLLNYLFIFKKYYEEIVKELPDYNVYDVNEAYMLLYPKNTSSINFSLNLINIDEFFKIEPAKINLRIDKFFKDAITKILKTDIHYTSKESISEEKLFRWNIFMIGHGIADEVVAGIPHPIFVQLLRYFNNNMVNTFSVLSCYSGGKTLKEFFGNELFSVVGSSVKNISYTILFFGAFFSPVRSTSFIRGWQDYTKNFVKNDYSSFFKSIKEKDYFLALAHFSEFNKKINDFNNYGAVKFPHVNWITMSDYRKDLFDITKIRIAATYPDYVIEIPDSKNIVLMNTNVIPLHIHINMAHRGENNQCKFLPIYYMDQNYSIDYLRLTNVVITPIDREKQIAEVLYNLFNLNISSLSEQITIYIKQAFIGGYSVDNILIYLKNKKIFFESINRPGMLVSGEDKLDGFSVEKIEPSNIYTFQVNRMKKRLNLSIDSDGFLAGMNHEFMRKLEKSLEQKKISKLNPYAKPFSKLNPTAKFFIPKIQPLQFNVAG